MSDKQNYVKDPKKNNIFIVKFVSSSDFARIVI